MEISRASALAVIAALGVLLTMAGDARQSDPGVLLRAAIEKEDVAGDLERAMILYRQIIAANGKSRAVTAKALLRLGGCYEKLGQTEARKFYERLVAEYPDQAPEVTSARTRLAALTGAAGATASGAARDLTLTKIYSGDSYAASISPDGKRLAITRPEMSSRDIWLRDITTGEETRLTNLVSVSADPVWSPDSRWMAFADQGREIKIVPVEGGAAKTLFTTEPGSQQIAGLVPTNWTSDSKKVVFRVPGKGLFSVAAAGGEPAPVCTFENADEEKKHEGMTVSPDGRWVAYSAAQNANTDIFVMPATGGSPIRVTTSPATERKPRWSPDGNWLAFISLGNENPQIWAVKVSPDGQPDGAPVQVSRDAQVFGGDWTSGGRVGFSTAFRIEHIFTANADGTRETQLTQFSSFHAKPRWSPNGRWIAFRSDYRKQLNRFRLWTVPSAGGIPRLVSDKEVGSSFVWSGDGEELLYETEAGLNRSVIMEIPAQGGEPREIMTIPGDIDGLSLSPDGRSLYYTFTLEPARYGTTDVYLKERTSGIGVAALGGGEPRILIPADKKGIWYSDCRVDPDGKRIVYMVFDYAQFKQEGMYSIWALDLDGGTPRKITNGGEYLLCWSPDGKWIVYEQRIKDMDFELYKVSPGGGEPVRMNIRGRSPEFSPDRKRITFSRRIDAGYEYWLAENVLPAQAGKVK
jgi:Tol biopolymer transport system component